jgi:small subunit ribosomal protein S4e
MGKRGARKHMKRIAVPTVIPVHDKKDNTWMVRTQAGPHPRKYAIPLAVLVRDVLKVARTAKETKQILSGRMVQVDGKVRTEDKFPVGLMDTITIPKSKKSYRIMVDRKGRFFPMEIDGKDALKKLLQVVRKHTVRKGKLNLTFHDGKNLMGDNHIRVGDTVTVSLPKAKVEDHLKRDVGARCLVVEGKHVGSMVKLKEVIERAGGKPSEALVEDEKGGEFVTVLKYLFVVDKDFKIEGEAA